MTRLREDVVTLSSGSIWAWLIPAEPGDEWPVDALTYTRFKNTAGAELAVIEATEVTAAAIKFLAQPEDVDDIPAGASFETFVETDDGPMKIRYGIVRRREARAFHAPSVVQTVSRQFTDNFQRTALGWRWEPVKGSKNTVIIYDHSAQSLPSGLGPNVTLFENRVASIRYYQPLAGDTVKSTMSIVMMPVIFTPNNGKLTMVVCADQNFTTGLGLQVDTINAQVHMAYLTRLPPPSPAKPGAIGLVYLGSAAADTAASNNTYTLEYDELTDTFSIFKGVSTTPLITPVTPPASVAHGPGFRYLGFILEPTFLETGPQVSGWAAKDEV